MHCFKDNCLPGSPREVSPPCRGVCSVSSLLPHTRISPRALQWCQDQQLKDGPVPHENLRNKSCPAAGDIAQLVFLMSPFRSWRPQVQNGWLQRSYEPRLPLLISAQSWVPPGRNICPSKTNALSPKQADGEGQAREGRSKQIPLQPLTPCNDFVVQSFLQLSFLRHYSCCCKLLRRVLVSGFPNCLA